MPVPCLWLRLGVLSTTAALAALAAASGCGRSCAPGGRDEPGTFASAIAVKQDCPTGLARCVGGAVEVTAGHPSCAGCPCAWRRVLVCPNGCAVENDVVTRGTTDAPSLCRSGAVAATRPPIDAAAASCPHDGERFLCRSSMVYACPPSTSAVPVAVCTYGCAGEGETLRDKSADVARSTAVLCRRRDAGIMPP